MNVSVHPAAIERAMSAAQQLLASLGDDAEDITLRTDCLEGESDVIAIVKTLVRAALDAEAFAEAAKARVDDLNTRRDRFTARAQSARETAKAMLDALGINRIQDPEFTVSLSMGPGKVLIPEPDKLPEEFWRVTRAPDRIAIGKALAAGRVPGATLSNGSQILSVRTK